MSTGLAATQAAGIPAGTPEWVVAHARRQQRHFRWCERAHSLLPRGLHARAAQLIPQQFSPELPEAAKIWRGLQQFSGCSDAQAHALLSLWYANQGQFAFDLHDYPRLDARWAAEDVVCNDRALLADIAARGGLVLTYHSQHHNRSGAFLGLSGTCVWGIAATEENSLWKPWTARFVRLINGGSQSHFGGGTYLFTDELRHLLKQSRDGLQKGQTVVTLCDNDSDSPGATAVNLCGRRLRVATGMIELALELSAPITFALFHGDLQGRYRCQLARPAAGLDAPAIAKAYIAQLMQWCLAAPWAWQGWMWWDDLPLFDAPDAAAPGDSTQLQAWRSALVARFEASRPGPGLAARCLAGLGRLETRLSPPRP